MQKIKKSVVLTLSIAVLFLFGSIAVNSIMKVQASSNTIDNFGNDSQSSGAGSADESQSSSDETSSSNGGSANTNPGETAKGSDNTNPGETSSNIGTNNPSQKPDIRNQLVNPNAFNYQTNPATPTVDISKDPNQKVNSAVTNSFGQGVENIDIDIKVKDPANVEKTISGKTDKDGKSIITIPITTPGKYSAVVTIKSSPAVGGPFTDTITWDAIKGAAPAALTTDVKLARTTVVLSDDPRQQILTTVKDAAGKGVKDVPLTIKLTNADGLSKTFSRITDSKGIDEFVTPIDKEGKWSATITVIGLDGKPLSPISVAWKVIP